jgi:hypothetical protein
VSGFVPNESLPVQAERLRQKGAALADIWFAGQPFRHMAIEVRSHDALLLDIVIVQIVGALPELAHSN